MSAETRLRRGDEPKGVQKVFKLTDKELSDLQKYIADNPKEKAPAPIQGVAPGQAPVSQGNEIARLEAMIRGLQQRVAQLEAKNHVAEVQAGKTAVAKKAAPKKKAAAKKSA